MARNNDGCGGRVGCAQNPRVSLAKAEIKQVRRNHKRARWDKGGIQGETKALSTGISGLSPTFQAQRFAPFALLLSVVGFPPTPPCFVMCPWLTATKLIWKQ